jgi:hypothetical protein
MSLEEVILRNPPIPLDASPEEAIQIIRKYRRVGRLILREMGYAPGAIIPEKDLRFWANMLIYMLALKGR